MFTLMTYSINDEYWNLLNGTSNVVMHEWAFDLNTSLENLNFQIASIFITMHFCCFKTSLYVPMTCVFFSKPLICMCKDNVLK